MSKQPLIDQLDEAIGRILADPGAQPSSVDASLVELLAIARELRELPGPDFKASLRADLERKISMSTKVKEVVFRPGFRTVTPYLLPPGAEYIDFLKGVFGAEETEHTVTSPTSFHSEVKIGDSMLMLGVGSGRSMPASLIVYVKNSDETYRRALDAGAAPVTEMIESYGDRFGCVKDGAGNSWCIATYLGGPAMGQEHVNTVTLLFSLKGAARFIDFLKRAFSAEEIVRYDSPEGEVNHAKIRIGGSAVAVGEAHGEWQPMPTMTYLYVPNVDAVYEQALRAGAKSIHPPADQYYGDRSGGVTDEWGNQWYMATPL
jgi:PhnB protein